MCTKRTFASLKQATTEMHKIKRTSHRSEIPRRAYWCSECNGFHLTKWLEKPW